AAAVRAGEDRRVPAPRATPPVRRPRRLSPRGPHRLLDGRTASLVDQKPLQCQLGVLARASLIREIARKGVEPLLERQRFRLQHNASDGGRPPRLNDPAGRREEITLPSQFALKTLHSLLLAEPAGGLPPDLHPTGQR